MLGWFISRRACFWNGLSLNYLRFPLELVKDKTKRLGQKVRLGSKKR